jgi:pimeloyl-ACP methyl ester carboxylesterase
MFRVKYQKLAPLLLCVVLALSLSMLSISGCAELRSEVDSYIRQAKDALVVDPGDDYNASEDFKRNLEELEKAVDSFSVLGGDNSTNIEQGRLIFLTHGLEDDAYCFLDTVKQLVSTGKYIDFGYITGGTSRYILDHDGKFALIYDTDGAVNYSKEFSDELSQDGEDMIKTINRLTGAGKHILIRTQFSRGNLSFAYQLTEMGFMIGFFDKFGYSRFDGITTSNVVFVGHSMGGLASINYGVDYAKGNADKTVTIITVDTPYSSNHYAAAVWNDPSSVVGWFAKQQKGEAHRDLGGIGSAMKELRSKWNRFNGTNIDLYAIAVSMTGKNDMNWSAIGDGVVDIPSQLGYPLNFEWERVNPMPIIYGHITESDMSYDAASGATPLGSLSAVALTTHEYHHVNTPDRTEVVEQIRNIVES